jgi:hypothetical protein
MQEECRCASGGELRVGHARYRGGIGQVTRRRCHERKRPMRHTRIIVTHYGGPDELRVVEEECPEPKAGEVRVRVLAAGVAPPDLLMREGVHPETPPLPKQNAANGIISGVLPKGAVLLESW